MWLVILRLVPVECQFNSSKRKKTFSDLQLKLKITCKQKDALEHLT